MDNQKNGYRYYIQVKNTDSNKVSFIAFDRASGGYPYLTVLQPEFMDKHRFDYQFDSVHKNINNHNEMSGGSLDIHHEVRYIAELSNALRSATMELSGYEVISFEDGIKTRKIRELTFFVKEGNGVKERHLTEGKILSDTVFTE